MFSQRLKEQSKDVNSTREQQFSVYVSGANEDRMRQLQVRRLPPPPPSDICHTPAAAPRISSRNLPSNTRWRSK